MLSNKQKNILGVLALSAAGITMATYQAKAVPHVFTAGQKIKASEVNANFAAVEGGGGGQSVVLTTPGTHTIVPLAGFNYAKIEAIGGGAAGAAGMNAVFTGSDCAGGYAKYVNVHNNAVDPVIGKSVQTTINLSGITSFQVTVGPGGAGASVGDCNITSSTWDGVSASIPMTMSSPSPIQSGSPSKVLVTGSSGTFLAIEAGGGYNFSSPSVQCSTAAPSPIPLGFSGTYGIGGAQGLSSLNQGGGCPNSATAGGNGSSGAVIIRYFN